MTSHLIEIRKYFFKKNNKNLFDETLFQSFIPDCVGDTIDPMREAREEYKKKRAQNKPMKWRYHPKSPRAAPDYKFANTSGNEIQKSRNLKIGTKLSTEEIPTETTTELTNE